MAEEPLDLLRALRQVTAALDDAGIPYALCGGLAVTVHGAVRSTTDIDLLVRPEDTERIVDHVRDLGWKFRAHPMTFDPGTPRARRLERVSRIEGGRVLMLDLVQLTPYFQTVWDSRLQLQFEGQRLSVVSLEGLAMMKRAAGRAQDHADLEKLGLG